MKLSRRGVLATGGGLAASLLAVGSGGAAGPVEILMRGSKDGGRISFDPIGLFVEPGQRIRFVNRDAGNTHTATTYAPAIDDRPLRIPSGAKAWDSDYLDPGQSFEVALDLPGVYDFYCRPHEHAGMVGRVVVGREGQATGWEQNQETGDLEPELLANFPEVDRIVAAGRVAPDW